MNLKQKLLFLTLLFCGQKAAFLPKAQTNTPLHIYVCEKLMNTRVGFHIWMNAARIKYRTSFTCHQIAGDQERQDLKTTKNEDVCIQYDKSGKIVTIHDGKQTPLVLGSIPTKQQHLDRLKSMSQSNNDSKNKIGIFSLNKCWECQTSGLFRLIKSNPEINHYRYPTTDMHAPSFIDIVRAVHDLENRDNSEQQISLVHCKAGRGRSATIACAYVMHIMHKAHLHTTPDEIEVYLCKHRPQVHLESAQKETLLHFWSELQTAGNFDNLYTKYMPKIKQRAQEVEKLNSLK